MRAKGAASKAKPARANLTAKRASKTTQELNGTPKSASAKKTPTKAPTKTPKPPATPSVQPAELSDADRVNLREWLEHTDRPFEVYTVPLSRKRKRADAQLQLQDDLFEDRLAVQYEVKPRDKWESLRRYKKFTGKR